MSARRVIASVLFLVLVLTPTVASASTANYAITIPATGDVYSSSYSVTGGYDFGVRHKYSGGKAIVMQAVKATDYASLGSSKTIYPGGSTAPLQTLWSNTGSSRSVRARMNSAIGVVVTVLAEGTWVWNY